jgi:UDP-N-acetylmuramoyl-tripeptide--D-alanyl-D-alanine ligase
MNTPLWTSVEAEAATGARAARPWRAGGVSIDSRTLQPGDLFVALRGETHDGHDHIAAAFAAGAAAALIARDDISAPLGAILLRVPDTLAALVRLAAAARARSAARIVAVTGSVGKTSTKEALRRVLAAHGATHAAAASHNNHIGVPLTLARLPREAEFAVVEIGMNHPGEIAPLTRLARPEIAIITTVEGVHTEFFVDGIDGVAREKSEIFAAGGETAVLNRDNSYFAGLATRAIERGVKRIASFGAAPDASYRLLAYRDDAEDGGSVEASLRGRPIVYRLGSPGRHSAMNSLAVLAVADALAIELESAAAIFASITPPKGRGARHRVAGFELIDDSYNASPASMRAAFAVLAAARPGPRGRRIAVLGDMLELGPRSGALHAELADALLRERIDIVLTCGANMALLSDALPTAMRGGHAASSDKLLPIVRATLRAGDVVVVKGSLGSRMGRIIDGLLAESADAPTRAAC